MLTPYNRRSLIHRSSNIWILAAIVTMCYVSGCSYRCIDKYLAESTRDTRDTDQRLVHHTSLRRCGDIIFKIVYSWIVSRVDVPRVSRMHGREHIFWAILGFSIFIFAFSVQQGYYDPGNFTWFALIVTIVATMAMNELTNVVSLKNQPIDKKSTDPSIKVTRSTMNLLETGLRIITYVCLGFVVIVCTFVGAKGADDPFYIIWAYIVAMFSGLLPDFLDSTIPGDMRFHRDPWTHSTVFASAAAGSCLLFVHYDNISLNLFAIAFLLGNTAHLLCDNIESKSTLIAAFKNPLHWRECPGDIRKIDERYERAWLNSQAVMAFVLFVFISLRYGMTSADDGFMAGIVVYDGISGSFVFTTTNIMVLSVLGLCYILTIVSFVVWQKRSVAKRTTKRRQ